MAHGTRHPFRHLRALSAQDGAAPALERAPEELSADPPRPQLRLIDQRPRVLLAGGSSLRRTLLACEVVITIDDAVIVEAQQLWEVLARAPECDAVVLAGDLQDAPLGSLRRLLGHRHPDLPQLTTEQVIAARRAAVAARQHRARARSLDTAV